jgi:O-antigen ligase
VGLIYSENFSKGLNIVFSRLSLLIFPLLFIYPGQNFASKSRTLLKIFTVGTTLFIVYSLVFAVFRSTSIIDGQVVFDVHPGKLYWLSYFRGSDFSFNQHPSYTAIFAAFSILISVDILIENKNRAAGIFWLVTALILLLSIYLLSSRTGFLVVLITLPSYFFIRIRKEKRTLISAVFIVLVIAGSFAIIRTNGRMKYYMEEISKGTFLDQSSTDSRILIWESGLNIIRQNLFFGVGVGDVRDELMKQYVAIGNEELIKSRYNAHNQFIETTIEGGLVSLLVFVSIIVYAGYVAITHKDLLLTMFILIIVISFMFETVLYRFAGVVYFTSILFVLFQNEHLKSNQKT